MKLFNSIVLVTLFVTTATVVVLAEVTPEESTEKFLAHTIKEAAEEQTSRRLQAIAEAEFDAEMEKKYGVVTRRLTLGHGRRSLRQSRRHRHQRRRLAAGAFAALLAGINGISGTVQSATQAVQGVVNLFGKTSSETIVQNLKDQGFKKFFAKTDVKIVSMHTTVWDAYVRSAMKTVWKFPKKHKEGAEELLRMATKVYKQEWETLDTTFDEQTGGRSKNFQIMTYRKTKCETMHAVIIRPDIRYKLKEDMFVISKQKTKLGGAFSTTKLVYKKMPRGLSIDDIKFVTEYFQVMALQKLAESRTKIMNYEEPCEAEYKPPPEPIDPFDVMDDDDEEEDDEEEDDEDEDEEVEIWNRRMGYNDCPEGLGMTKTCRMVCHLRWYLNDVDDICPSGQIWTRVGNCCHHQCVPERCFR